MSEEPCFTPGVKPSPEGVYDLWVRENLGPNHVTGGSVQIDREGLIALPSIIEAVLREESE